MHCLLNLLNDSRDHAWALRRWPLKIIHPKHPFTLHSNIPWQTACWFPEQAKVWCSRAQGHFSAAHLPLLSHDLTFYHCLVSPTLPLAITTPNIYSLFVSSKSATAPPYSAWPAPVSRNHPLPTPEIRISCPTVFPAQQMLDQAVNLTKAIAWYSESSTSKRRLHLFCLLGQVICSK